DFFRWPATGYVSARGRRRRWRRPSDCTPAASRASVTLGYWRRPPGRVEKVLLCDSRQRLLRSQFWGRVEVRPTEVGLRQRPLPCARDEGGAVGVFGEGVKIVPAAACGTGRIS